MEPLHSAPEESSFVLLAEHQSRTPASFHTGPPVLHYHSKRCKAVVLETDLHSVPALGALKPTGEGVNGSETSEEGKEVVVEGVDVWVTSDKFLLYVPANTSGVSIPYPSISLHAIQRLQLPNTPADSPQVQGLYMQITKPSTPSAVQDDEEEESVTLTLISPPEAEGTSTDETATLTAAENALEDQAEKPDETPTQMLYAAVCACSNLHPDPGLDGDGDGEGGDASTLLQTGLAGAGTGAADGGLPPPVEGSGGWITADNMHEFFDEEGNWIAGGPEPMLPLGPGAGMVREREGEGEGENGGEDGADEDETKWRRTD